MFRYTLKHREKMNEQFRNEVYWKQDEVVRKGGCLEIRVFFLQFILFLLQLPDKPGCRAVCCVCSGWTKPGCSV